MQRSEHHHGATRTIEIVSEQRRDGKTTAAAAEVADIILRGMRGVLLGVNASFVRGVMGHSLRQALSDRGLDTRMEGGGVSGLRLNKGERCVRFMSAEDVRRDLHRNMRVGFVWVDEPKLFDPKLNVIQAARSMADLLVVSGEIGSWHRELAAPAPADSEDQIKTLPVPKRGSGMA